MNDTVNITSSVLTATTTTLATSATASLANWTSEIIIIPSWATVAGNNSSSEGNGTVEGRPDGGGGLLAGLPLDSLLNILIAIVLALLILVTAIGNVFVIAVILLERHLQSVANYLILSLAVADLLVACLVMPLGAVYQVTGKWLLGPELCDMWTSSDVLCCTASILHLVAIATDRYWAVTSVDYIHRRTFARISVMILLVWSVSGLVSCFPLFGWKDPDWHQRLEYQQCLISQDVGYQVFATLSTFYLPLAIILFLYWRIFVTAKRRIRRRKPQAGALNLGRGAMSSAAPTTSTTGASVSLVTAETACTIASAMAAAVGVLELGRPRSVIEADEPSMVCRPGSGGGGSGAGAPSHRTIMRRNTSVAAVVAVAANNKRRNMRERKAAKTLAIITGAFVVCWLPFFVIALLMPVCSECHFDDNMVAFFLWLGYFNSTLNPILYTIFSPEFRNAFQKLLRIKRPGSTPRNTSAGRGQNNRSVPALQQNLQQDAQGLGNNNGKILNEDEDQVSNGSD